MLKQMKDFKKNPDEFPAGLSADAKAVLKQFMTLNLDYSRTFKADCIDGNRIIEKASDNVKKQNCEKSILERLLQDQQG